MIRVMMSSGMEVDLATDLEPFAKWVNGLSDRYIVVNEFNGWVDTSGIPVYLDRLSVESARTLR
jgi:hypothetical protein